MVIRSGPGPLRLAHSIWLVPATVLAVYLYTLTPVVGLIDSGELAAGCRLLNILHPTGYPLYTVLGRVVSLVPVASVVQRVAALSAILAAVGVGLILLLMQWLGTRPGAAGVTASLFAFSFPVWSVAVDVEVYALTVVLSIAIWLAVTGASGRTLLLAGYLGGLALTNHMSVVSVLVGAGIVLVVERGGFLRRRLVAFSLLFILGLSLYLFLVLRARAGPLLAWGNTVSLERLFWHVTGKQYQVWMFSLPFPQVVANAGKGLVLLARSFLYVLVPVVFYGAVRLYKERRGLCIGLAMSAILCFLYAVNYSIPDIEAYYLPCLVALMVFFGIGLQAIAARLGRWQHLAWAAGVAALVFNYPAASRRDFHVSQDEAMNTLASAEDDAIILTDWWDVYSPIFYLQHIEGVRPDVCIIDKELVRRSWYLVYLEKAYPWLIESARAELVPYLRYLDEFEHDRLRDPEGTQRAYIRLLESFVENNPERPAYVTFAKGSNLDASQMFPHMRWVPVGLLFELRADSVITGFDYSRFNVRLPRRPDSRTQANLYRYQMFCQARISALVGSGRTDEAEQVVRWYRATFETSE